jgi:KaiC/GvpD/RAD55 family RecA-like ATPase/DNA-binding NarL/FixJ family response regulator
MISSGIDALDKRLGGGLLESRYYVIGGSPGAGKTTACMQYLIEGLDRGERCALLTQENPSDLLDQARFLGYDFRQAAERDQLAVVQYRLDFAHNYSRTANPEVLGRELIAQIGGNASRLVIDTILPFADVGSGAHHAANALLHVMEHMSPTALFTVPGDVSDPYYTRLYDSVLSGAGGIFHLTTVQGGVRELALRKVRQGPTEWAPLRMILRPGVGLVAASPVGAPGGQERRSWTDPGGVATVAERTSAETVESTAGSGEPGKDILVIDAGRKISTELAAAISHAYRVQQASGAEPGAKPPENVGAVLIALDPHDPEGALDLVRRLRHNESEQAIALVVTDQGFRTATRARALRAGADDVIEYDLSPKSVLDRVELARLRGHQPMAGARQDMLLLQPTDENGTPLPVDESELARAVERHIAGSEHPFFALAVVKPGQGARAEAWNALSSELRLTDGDLLAECSDGRLAMYLHDISRKRVLELMTRIRANHPTLRLAEETVHAYPLDASAIKQWCERAGMSEQRASA